MRGKYGYEKTTQGLAAEAQIEETKAEEAEQIDFEKEVEKVLQDRPWTSEVELIASVRKQFQKISLQLSVVCSQICKFEGAQEPAGLEDFLSLDEGTAQECLLAMLIQNGKGDNNAQRRQMITDNTLKNVFDHSIAQQALREQLRHELMAALKSSEAEIVNKYKKSQGDALALKILQAPDVFTAVVIMKSNPMFFGKGDFQAVIKVLSTQANGFKDVARKLHVLKHGFLVSKDHMLAQKLPEQGEAKLGSMLKVYQDEKYAYIKHSIYYKHVFRIWATHIYGNDEPCISLEELKQIFPEFTARLDVYHNCCNNQGQIVKNKEFYAAYLKKGDIPHGKRAGKAL